MARSSADRRLRNLAALVTAGYEQRRYTHFALIVGSGTENLLESTGPHGLCAGIESSRLVASIRKPPRVSGDPLFDLASLTKPLATASSILLLAQRRELQLSDKLCRFFPTLGGLPLGARPVQSLLTHTSGLPAWLNLHSPPVRGAARTARICEQPLASGAPYAYSDLGFMLLGELISLVTQRTLPEFVRAELFAPLAMRDTRFRPSAAARCVPTEHDATTGGPLRGVVHDENCRAARGVSGHAGLFSTAADVARFARNLLAARPQLFSRATRRRITENQIAGTGGATCGWFTLPNPMLPGVEAFRKCRVHAFGHTGFTGTSLVVAPLQRLFIVLLTNRVHCGRTTPEFVALRRQVHHEFARLCAAFG